MYGKVKNPFGLRNGKYITVNDLSENERGLACNCICPLCKDPFEARLGTVRVHHFAHSGDGCDEVASYLMGLYGFFREYVTTAVFRIPELCVYYQVDKRSDFPITSLNYAGQIAFYPQNGFNQKRILSKEVQLVFDSAEIVFGKAKRPEAVIATYHGRRIAFVISAPDTVCMDFKAKPYKEIATLEIMLSKKADIISRANTEMMNAIFSDVKNYRWLSSPLVFSAFERINLERKEAYQAYQAEIEKIRLQQEEASRKQEELYRQEQELRRQELEKQQKEAKEEKERHQLEEAQRDAKDQELVNVQIKIPGQLVIDSRDRRWIQCEVCGKIATVDDFSIYQWNRGQCKECSKKRTPIVSKNSVRLNQSEKKMIQSFVCPWCGGKLVKRKGRNGEFLGCSSYPECRYSRSV